MFYENYLCGSERNYTGYCNDEVDKLINQQSAESDVERRHQIVWQIEKSVFRLDRSAHGAAGRSTAATPRQPLRHRVSPMSQVRSVTYVSGPQTGLAGGGNGIRTPGPAGYRNLETLIGSRGIAPSDGEADSVAGGTGGLKPRSSAGGSILTGAFTRRVHVSAWANASSRCRAPCSFRV